MEAPRGYDGVGLHNQAATANTALVPGGAPLGVPPQRLGPDGSGGSSDRAHLSSARPTPPLDYAQGTPGLYENQQHQQQQQQQQQPLDDWQQRQPVSDSTGLGLGSGPAAPAASAEPGPSAAVVSGPADWAWDGRNGQPQPHAPCAEQQARAAGDCGSGRERGGSSFGTNPSSSYAATPPSSAHGPRPGEHPPVYAPPAQEPCPYDRRAYNPTGRPYGYSPPFQQLHPPATCPPYPPNSGREWCQAAEAPPPPPPVAGQPPLPAPSHHPQHQLEQQHRGYGCAAFPERPGADASRGVSAEAGGPRGSCVGFDSAVLQSAAPAVTGEASPTSGEAGEASAATAAAASASAAAMGPDAGDVSTGLASRQAQSAPPSDPRPRPRDGPPSGKQSPQFRQPPPYAGEAYGRSLSDPYHQPPPPPSPSPWGPPPPHTAEPYGLYHPPSCSPPHPHKMSYGDEPCLQRSPNFAPRYAPGYVSGQASSPPPVCHMPTYGKPLTGYGLYDGLPLSADAPHGDTSGGKRPRSPNADRTVEMRAAKSPRPGDSGEEARKGGLPAAAQVPLAASGGSAGGAAAAPAAPIGRGGPPASLNTQAPAPARLSGGSAASPLPAAGSRAPLAVDHPLAALTFWPTALRRGLRPDLSAVQVAAAGPVGAEASVGGQRRRQVLRDGLPALPGAPLAGLTGPTAAGVTAVAAATGFVAALTMAASVPAAATPGPIPQALPQQQPQPQGSWAPAPAQPQPEPQPRLQLDPRAAAIGQDATHGPHDVADMAVIQVPVATAGDAGRPPASVSAAAAVTGSATAPLQQPHEVGPPGEAAIGADGEAGGAGSGTAVGPSAAAAASGAAAGCDAGPMDGPPGAAACKLAAAETADMGDCEPGPKVRPELTCQPIPPGQQLPPPQQQQQQHQQPAVVKLLLPETPSEPPPEALPGPEPLLGRQPVAEEPIPLVFPDSHRRIVEKLVSSRLEEGRRLAEALGQRRAAYAARKAAPT